MNQLQGSWIRMVIIISTFQNTCRNCGRKQRMDIWREEAPLQVLLAALGGDADSGLVVRGLHLNLYFIHTLRVVPVVEPRIRRQ